MDDKGKKKVELIKKLETLKKDRGGGILENNITKRKQAEEKLKDAEEYLKILFDYAPDAYYINDLKGNFVDGNLVAERLTGYKRKELIGKNFLKLKLLALADIPKAAKLLEKNLRGHPSGPNEFVLNRKDNTKATVEISTYPVKIKGKTLALGIVRDITERKNAEKNIKSAKDELQAIFDGIEDGICVIDESYQILRANQRILKIFDKRSFSDLLGKRCFIEYFDNRKTCRNCPVQKTFENAEPYRLTKIYQKRNKTKVILDITAFPLKDDEGRVIQMIVYLKNITDMVNLEEQVLFNERLTEVGELAAGVAHEIKNPLGNIVAAAQFCLFKQQINEKTKNYLEIILRNAENANKIIKQLMTFAKPRELSFKLENITHVIDRVCILVETMCAKQKVTVIKKWSRSIPPILLDSNLLEQTFLNIILNALNAMPNGGDLTITALVNIKQNEILVSFIDTGKGISPENLDKVIEPFFTTEETGIGLGLSFVRHAIDCHKGKMSIKSKVGQGTEVWVRFPILR